jgi:hypothetical protein
MRQKKVLARDVCIKLRDEAIKDLHKLALASRVTRHLANYCLIKGENGNYKAFLVDLGKCGLSDSALRCN